MKFLPESLQKAGLFCPDSFWVSANVLMSKITVLIASSSLAFRNMACTTFSYCLQNVVFQSVKRRINSLLRKAYILCNWSLINHVQFIFGSKQMRALLVHFSFYGKFKTWPNSQLEYCIHSTWEEIFSYFVHCRLKISKGSYISPKDWCKNEAWHKILRHFPSPSF